jgi:hypothetical protein
MKLDNTDPIFGNHSILKDITVIEKVLCDGFEKKPSVELLFDCSYSKTDDDVFYMITIRVNIYIIDTLALKLKFVDKHVTPTQFIEHIDYRFEQYIP